MPVDISDLNFEERIACGDCAWCFRVSREGQHYFLKVYHRVRRNHAHASDREIDPFKSESLAYLRLEECGVCDKGIVPKLYAVMYDINPIAVHPHLAAFEKDQDPPCAILLEYVPNIEPLDLATFNPSRAERFRNALHEIHSCNVLHMDIEARHLVTQTTTDRILWIDFDRAQVFPPNNLIEKWQRAFITEAALADELLRYLAQDAVTGRLNKAWRWYHYGNPPTPLCGSLPVSVETSSHALGTTPFTPTPSPEAFSSYIAFLKKHNPTSTPSSSEPSPPEDSV